MWAARLSATLLGVELRGGRQAGVVGARLSQTVARGQVAAGKGMWLLGCVAPHLGGPARVTAPHPSPRPVHHFNLGRRIPGFDYGPDGFGTGLTPLHLSDDGEGGTFHFHDPPPPYTAYKYPDIDQPDDPPPPYEASINPDSVFYDPADDDAFEPAEATPPATGDGSGEGTVPRHPERTPRAPLANLEDSADSSSALLVPPEPCPGGGAPAPEALPGGGRHSRGSLNTVV